MNVAVAQTPKPIQEDLRYHLPRWMVVVAAIVLIQQLTAFSSTGRGVWTLWGSVLIGLLEGAFGGLVFVGLQRWWNPKDNRVRRIRNYVFAIMVVGVGSLFMITAIYR